MPDGDSGHARNQQTALLSGSPRFQLNFTSRLTPRRSFPKKQSILHHYMGLVKMYTQSLDVVVNDRRPRFLLLSLNLQGCTHAAVFQTNNKQLYNVIGTSSFATFDRAEKEY